MIQTRRRTSAPRFRATLAVAMTLGLSGLVTAPSAVAAQGDPSDLAEGCEGAPSASSKFTDYGTLNVRQRDVVDCLSDGYKGNASSDDWVLQGNAGRVNFNATVTRAQFAAILNRAADYLGVPAHTGNPNKPTFADVTSSNFFFYEIEELFARGLTQGAGADKNDVDNDGDTNEPTYNPSGSVTYGQGLAFVERLLTDGANEPLAGNQSHGQANNLDCGFFNPEKATLDNAGFLLTANTPTDCRVAAARGLIFDLIAVSFDETVESGKISNPFVDAPGSISLSLDKSSAFTNEVVNATVTVLDSSGQPLGDQFVEVFAVKSDDAFDGSGNPKASGFLNVGGTNRHGTGNTPAVIDSADPKTKADGTVTTTVMTTSTSAMTFDVYAFVGKTGVVYKDVKATSDATGKKTIAFKAIPSQLLVTSAASPTNTLKYNTFHTVTYQLADANGAPVEVADVKIIAELFRRDICNNAPPASGPPCDGVTRLFATQTLTTDSKGKVAWAVNGAPDPQPSNGAQDPPGSGPFHDGGDRTTDSFRGTWDQNNNGIVDDPIKTASDLVMTFLDAKPGKVEVAKMRFLNGNQPNRPAITGARVATVVNVQVDVTDVYGNAAEGVPVRLERNLGTTMTEVRPTGSNGVSVFSLVGPYDPADHSWTGNIDAGRNGFDPPNTADNFSATTPSGSTTLQIIWVIDPVPVVTFSNQLIAGFNISGDGGFLDLQTAQRRVPFDGGDTYQINGEASSRAAFASAIQADTAGDDRVSVTPYQAGGVSTWNLVVNGGAGPVGTP